MQLIIKKTYTIFFLILLIAPSLADEIFVSLKKNKVNVRYGPSFESDIKYIYKKNIYNFLFNFINNIKFSG